MEEANRALEQEVGELRQLQDAAEGAGDARELARELRVRSPWQACNCLQAGRVGQVLYAFKSWLDAFMAQDNA